MSLKCQCCHWQLAEYRVISTNEYLCSFCLSDTITPILWAAQSTCEAIDPVYFDRTWAIQRQAEMEKLHTTLIADQLERIGLEEI